MYGFPLNFSGHLKSLSFGVLCQTLIPDVGILNQPLLGYGPMWTPPMCCVAGWISAHESLI